MSTRFPFASPATPRTKMPVRFGSPDGSKATQSRYTVSFRPSARFSWAVEFPPPTGRRVVKEDDSNPGPRSVEFATYTDAAVQLRAIECHVTYSRERVSKATASPKLIADQPGGPPASRGAKNVRPPSTDTDTNVCVALPQASQQPCGNRAGSAYQEIAKVPDEDTVEEGADQRRHRAVGVRAVAPRQVAPPSREVTAATNGPVAFSVARPRTTVSV